LFLAMQKLADEQSFLNLSITILLFICLLLTYSRSGLLAFFPGLIVFLILHWKKKIIFFFLTLMLLLIIIIAFRYNLIELIGKLGGIGKVIKISEMEQSGIYTNVRLNMWIHGLDFIKDNPIAMLLGVGYGELLVEKVTGIAFYESAFYQVFIEMGVIGILLLLLHFFTIILFIRDIIKNNNNKLKIWISKGYAYFMPGFILCNIFGANMVQTDFIAPIFYGFLGVCYSVNDAKDYS
jgi:O-antigen ligase